MKTFFGKELTDEEFEDLREDVRIYFDNMFKHKERQLDHIEKFISKLSQEEIEKWMDKFLKWEEKYEEFRYDKRHEQATSRIFNAFTNFIKKNGKEMRRSSEMFCTGGWKWNKYTIKLYQGQGCFWRIWKNRKVIFQTT
jgi:hypothetical protein